MQLFSISGYRRFGKLSKNREYQGVKVRILLPNNERSLEIKDYLKQYNSKNIDVKQVEDIRAKRIMVLVDNLHSLVMEIKENKGRQS